ncbi:MAG: ATP-binding cassette domain-containing protein [Acidobacteriota bacterium]
MGSGIAVTLRDVRKSFGTKRVLESISGDIEFGKVVGLLGRNGEGKTTLFKIMLDMLIPDHGTISVLGLCPDGTGSIRQAVGYIPERPVFHDFMMVEDVLKWRAAFFSKWNWIKAYKICANLDLDLKTPVKGASKGTLAKTSWVCATAHNPELLLFDEPTSGLDAVVRDSVLNEFISELSEEKKTIIVANHHMDEMAGILDEIWILADGHIREKHLISTLRKHSFRITGRLKNNLTLPEMMLYEENRTGDLVQWLTISPDTVTKIQELGLLDPLHLEPLSLDVAFKLLLKSQGERSSTS